MRAIYKLMYSSNNEKNVGVSEVSKSWHSLKFSASDS